MKEKQNKQTKTRTKKKEEEEESATLFFLDICKRRKGGRERTHTYSSNLLHSLTHAEKEKHISFDMHISVAVIEQISLRPHAYQSFNASRNSPRWKQEKTIPEFDGISNTRKQSERKINAGCTGEQSKPMTTTVKNNSRWIFLSLSLSDFKKNTDSLLTIKDERNTKNNCETLAFFFFLYTRIWFHSIS